MVKPLRLVVFDVDGTLIDSRAHIITAVQQAFADLKLPEPSIEAMLHGVGLSLSQYMAQLVPDHAPDVHHALAERYRSVSLARHDTLGNRTDSLFFPGMRAVLDLVRADDFTFMATATGMSRRGLDRIISQHGLQGYFQSTQVADTHPSKPHPSMLYAALSETGVEAGHAVMIGDTSYDIQMGNSAGMQTIGVTWGNHAASHLEGADTLVDSADQLTAALSSWMEGS